MQRKLQNLLWILLLISIQSYAQNRTITGTVTGKDDGLPLPGVTVRVSGTTTGTQTGGNGQYSIAVPANATGLEFSFIGYTPQKVSIGSGSVVNIALSVASSQLTEVVITGAYGVKQSSRATGASASLVSGEQLNTIRQTNINNALAGKATGLQVRSQSAGALGRQTEVRLRGATGFSTGLGALYIVDGTIVPNSDDLNPDDVESVTVLQGPAASAQFGSQGANGAIVITTKKGKKNNGVGITLNLGAQFDRVYVLPDYQNTYAGGSSADLIQYHWKDGDPAEWKALDGKYYPDYSDDSSWGPKMVGQEYIPWYAWAGGSPYAYKTASLTPQPDNAKNFYQTGITLNNNVAFTKAGDDYNIRMSYANQNLRGIIPNTSLNKNIFNLNTSYDLTKHLQVSANINYVGQKVTGEINDDYSNLTTGAFSQWFHRDLDMGIMKELRGLRSPDGTYVSWNHLNPTAYDPSNPAAFYGGNYWYNPYTFTDFYKQVEQRDRLYGNLALTYKVNDHFSVRGTYRRNQTNAYSENREYSELKYSATQTGRKGYYRTGNSYSNRENYEVLATYNQTFKDFTVSANAGTDIFNWIYKDNYANTNNGLTVDNLFTIGNSVDQPSVSNNRTQEQYRALLGRATVGYKNMAFITGNIRKDWYSTLKASDNAVVSKSIDGSFVFSELLPKSTQNWLSYAKLRASYGEIPVALGTSNETFGAYRYPGMLYGINQYKWAGNVLMGTPDQYVDQNLKGTVTRQSEFGLDLRFLNNRIGLTGTYYMGTDKGIPYTLSSNAASGFSSILTNIGLIKRKGLEFALSGNPVRIKNFNWTFNGTWSRQLENTVVEISNQYNVNRISVSGVWGSDMPYLIHQTGMKWGQIYGNGILRNADGVPILSSNGLYQNDPNVYFGSVLPKFTGGLQNAFTIYKNFSLNVNIDYQVGGKFVSLSQMFGTFSGLTRITAELNDKGNPVRDPVADGGGVHVTGVDANNAPVSYYVDAKTYFQGLTNNKTYDPYIYDLTFVKLRELGLGYNIPVKALGLSKAIQSATFQLTARDLWLIYAKTRGFDPSQIDELRGETSQFPGTRAFGFNLRITF